MFLGRDHVCSYATLGPILFCYGRHRPDVSSTAFYRECIRKATEKHPGKTILITYVGDRSTPRPEARERLVKLFQDMRSTICAAVFVIESRGFAAASQRAVATAFILGTGNRDFIKATASLSDALMWIARKLDDPQSSEQQAQMLREIRDFVASEDVLAQSA